MTIVNLTPHAVTLQLAGRASVVPASGQVARVAVEAWEVDRIALPDGGDAPLCHFRLGQVTGLPAPAEGVAYIVSRVVADAAPAREDLLVALGQLRDGEGRVVAAEALASPRGSVPLAELVARVRAARPDAAGDRFDRALAEVEAATAELPVAPAVGTPMILGGNAGSLAAVAAVRARWAALCASGRPVDRRVVLAASFRAGAFVPDLGCALADRGLHAAIRVVDAVVARDAAPTDEVLVCWPALRGVEAIEIDADPSAGYAAYPAIAERVARQIAERLDARHFLGADRSALLAQLASAPIVTTSPMKGGAALSLRLRLEGGLQAFCKPAQRNPWAQPRREVAAYRIALALGLHAVPPCTMRPLSRAELVDRLALDQAFFAPRLEREAVFDEPGMVAAWVAGLVDSRLDTLDAIRTWAGWLGGEADIPPRERDRMAQLSALLVFDRIIDNSDRFSGGGVEASADGATLFVIDNSFGLGDDPAGHPRCARHLARCTRFSRRLYERVQALDAAGIDAALAGDALLTATERAAVLARAQAVLAHIDGAIARAGADRTLAFP